MRPIVLGFAALGLFLGSLMMAPLTSEVAESSCVTQSVARDCVLSTPAPPWL